MNILGILLAALAILIGIRLAFTALQTALSGKILVRRGLHTQWQPAPTRSEAWKIAFRDGLMGILLIVLGTVLIL